MSKKHCCCNCIHCLRVKKGKRVDHNECELDGHRIDYINTFEGWCNKWSKEPDKKGKLKAYMAWDEKGEGSTVVFAESASKARGVALHTETCEDAEFTDIRVRRRKDMDCLYRRRSEIDFYDPATRLMLVRDFGWSCLDPDIRQCEKCIARPWCQEGE